MRGQHPRLFAAGAAAAIAAVASGATSFNCPVTNVNPSSAWGWGYMDQMPPPPAQPYWPVTVISASTFSISAVNGAGNVQSWCASSGTLQPNGDGTEIFSLPSTPVDMQGCGLLETVSPAPQLVRNITFTMGGKDKCPKNTLTSSSSIFGWTAGASDQPLMCDVRKAGVVPTVLQGSGTLDAYMGSFLMGSNNLTIAQYDWMKNANCVLNITALDAASYQVLTGSIVGGQPILGSCFWLRYDATAKTVQLALGSVSPQNPIMPAINYHGGAVSCPSSFDNALLVTNWSH